MRLIALCLTGSLMLFAGCAAAPRTAIPADLLRPVPRPMREVHTLRDAGLLIVDYDEALARANSQIAAVAEISGGR